MPASTLTARARSAPRSSMVVRARAMATASRWVRGRYSSRINTRATSVGRSTKAIRRCSRATPTAGLGTRRLDEAWETALQRVERCRERLDRMQMSDADDVRPDVTGLADDLSAAWRAP